MTEPTRRLYRNRNNRLLAGICGGLGEYFNFDPVIIRVLWCLLALTYGTGMIAYLIAWLIIPEEPISADTGSES